MSLITSLSFAKENAPYIWWGHATIKMSVEACLQRSELALETTGFSVNPINEDHNFVYAYKDTVRAAIQCLDSSDKSFVYLSVAGNDNSILEKFKYSNVRSTTIFFSIESISLLLPIVLGTIKATKVF